MITQLAKKKKKWKFTTVKGNMFPLKRGIPV